MSAYVIADVEVTDPAVYDEYRKLTGPSVAKFQGRFIVRGGAVERKEGDHDWHRVVVIEFPSLALARDWYASPDYQAAARIRQRAARTQLIVVEGA